MTTQYEIHLAENMQAVREALKEADNLVSLDSIVKALALLDLGHPAPTAPTSPDHSEQHLDMVAKAAQGERARFEAWKPVNGWGPASSDDIAFVAWNAALLQSPIAEWERLRDPAVLHANLLRGIPAKLSREQLLHLLGTDAPIADGVDLTDEQCRDIWHQCCAEWLGAGNNPYLSYARAILAAAKPQPERQGLTGWIPVTEKLPDTAIKRYHWKESARVVVRVKHAGEVAEAFARYTYSDSIRGEWNVEGHGGNWSDRVTHWAPLPPAPGITTPADNGKADQHARDAVTWTPETGYVFADKSKDWP